MDVVLLPLALVGHWYLWVATLNRFQATSAPKRAIETANVVCLSALVLVPLVAGWRLVGPVMSAAPGGPRIAALVFALPLPGAAYLAACWIGGCVAVARWFCRNVLRRPPAALHSTRTHKFAVLSGTSAACAHHLLVQVPGNESLQLDVTERVIELARLPASLDGISLVHLSDLHFTGLVGKAYFQEVVRLSNRFEPDLVVITGDVLDRPECLAWIPETLSGLRARCGVHFVLGNHDSFGDVPALLAALERGGLVHVGKRWRRIEARGQSVILAGNELPWIEPLVDLADCPPRAEAPLRIALAHSPDQLAWARQNDFDLLVAGHTHGGQICLPVIGPIFSPSRDGVEFASGVFDAPPTVMHVTRGLSGRLPLRVNCPPEMVHLRLRAGASRSTGSSPRA